MQTNTKRSCNQYTMKWPILFQNVSLFNYFCFDGARHVFLLKFILSSCGLHSLQSLVNMKSGILALFHMCGDCFSGSSIMQIDALCASLSRNVPLSASLQRHARSGHSHVLYQMHNSGALTWLYPPPIIAHHQLPFTPQRLRAGPHLCALGRAVLPRAHTCGRVVIAEQQVSAHLS